MTGAPSHVATDTPAAALVRARDREAALREILQVISRSRDDETPVFDAILENACKLCNAPLAYLSMTTEDGSHVISPARRGAFAKFGAALDNLRVPLNGSRLALARAIAECRVFREDDIRDHELYTGGDPNRVSMVEDEGARSLLVVPLVQEGRGVGSITLYRREVAPFSDGEVALVETFAAQAVIAIENVRQFRELQTRLERERATRAILHVISQSRDNEQPVFDLVLESAARHCGAPLAGLHILDEVRAEIRLAAQRGLKPETLAAHDLTAPLDEPVIISRAVKECAVMHRPDITTGALYDQRNPLRVAMVEVEGARSALVVPLVSKGVGIGCIWVFRREVRPYSEDEIALLQSFAAQAVIAIDNVRQFRALQDRTEEVQAQAEELQSLNTDLESRVATQVDQLERLGRLRRFLPAQVADAVVSSGDERLLSSHRALIAVMFCDIRGFTAFCETAEPEETIEVLQTYHEEMGRLIAAHGAGVDDRSGDGIMVIFNDPLPCDDPAGDALRLALAMRARMAELCRGWKRLGHRLGFGVGVALGYATVGMVGYEGRYEYTASGTAVNLAARLCDEAEDGEILLSPRAYAAVEDVFTAETRGEITFKGIHAPVEVFRVTGQDRNAA